MHYAYIYLFLTYSLAVWGNAAKVHINRIVTLQKQTIRLVYGIKRLDHVAPIAYKNNILLCFKCMKCHYHVSFFVVILCIIILVFLLVKVLYCMRSGLSAKSTHNSQYNLFLPYVRTSLFKRSIVYQNIALWNALPVLLKKLSSFKSFKHQFFHILLLRYCD